MQTSEVYVFDPVSLSCLVSKDWYDITLQDFTLGWSTLPGASLYSETQLNDIRIETSSLLRTYYQLLYSIPANFHCHERTFALFITIIQRDTDLSERLRLQASFHAYLKSELTKQIGQVSRQRRIEEMVGIY